MFALIGCKQEDLRSTNLEQSLVGEQPTTSPLASPQGKSSEDETRPQNDFQDVVKDGLEVYVSKTVSAEPICPNPSLDPVPLPAAGENKLEQLISIAFTEDPTCKKVFTGNGYNHFTDDQRSSYPDITYARVMAHTMAEDMCAENKLAIAFQGEIGKNDALKLNQFKDPKKASSNLAATYALTYALGQRESDGNFYQGRDQSADNTGVEEEVGFTQSSANSLNLSGGSPDTKNLLRDIFSTTVKKLSSLSSPAEKAKFCLSDKMQGNKQTRVFDKNQKKYIKTSYDTNGDNLDKAFSDGGACKESVPLVGTDFRVHSKKTVKQMPFLTRLKFEKQSKTITDCFKDLHKYCPGFSIRYGAAVTRVNRFHHGPLKPEIKSKPLPRPSCHMLFNSILSSKEQICHEMKVQNAEFVSSKTEGHSDAKDQPAGPVPSTPATNNVTDVKAPTKDFVGESQQSPTSASSTSPEVTASGPASAPAKESGSPSPSLQVSGSVEKPKTQEDPSKTGDYIIATDKEGAEVVIPRGVKLLVSSRPDEKSSLVLLNGSYYRVSNKELQKFGEDVVIPGPLRQTEIKETDEKQGDLKIISRETWDPGFKPRGRMIQMGKPMHVTLHYSAGQPNAEDDKEAKGIKNLHTNINGWTDIGYHFIIPREGVSNGNYSGDIYQARDIKYLGAHAGAGNNSGNIGIVLLGNFHPFHPSINPAGSKTNVPEPTPYQKETLRKLIGQLRKQYPNLTRLKGHGQLKSTSCPGQNAWPLINEINATEY